jgi:hypothetical protein
MDNTHWHDMGQYKTNLYSKIHIIYGQYASTLHNHITHI